ncbi:MAG: 4Fe-4S binding protein [Candidatus Brocadiia bacterium]
MCEFCTKHGEGKRWYLQARNYSDDLLSDARRRRLVEDFFSQPEALARSAARLDKLAQAPRFVQSIVRRLVTRKMKRDHFGQVVPLEEVEKIFGLVNSIVRVSCICRYATLGEDKRTCYGVSLGPDGGAFAEILRELPESFFSGPDTSGLETLTREEALAAFRSHEEEGLCHTIWTFRTPFIGGVCNCDRSDCLAMRSTVSHDLPLMFRAEFVAEVDPDACIGCRECMRLCQFGAITYSAARGKAVVDQRWCTGCGVCRAACSENAIRLKDRASSPVAAKLW